MFHHVFERSVRDEQMINDWHCIIEKAENGYVVTTREQLDDDSIVRPMNVFEETEDMHGDIKAFREMVYFLSDYFAIEGIRINIVDRDGTITDEE